MIDNWENGVIIQSFNLDEYADALIKLASDGNLRISMAEKAMKKVRQYDIDRVSDMWLDLFRKILHDVRKNNRINNFSERKFISLQY